MDNYVDVLFVVAVHVEGPVPNQTKAEQSRILVVTINTDHRPVPAPAPGPGPDRYSWDLVYDTQGVSTVPRGYNNSPTDTMTIDVVLLFITP